MGFVINNSDNATHATRGTAGYGNVKKIAVVPGRRLYATRSIPNIEQFEMSNEILRAMSEKMSPATTSTNDTFAQLRELSRGSLRFADSLIDDYKIGDPRISFDRIGVIYEYNGFVYTICDNSQTPPTNGHMQRMSSGFCRKSDLSAYLK